MVKVYIRKRLMKQEMLDIIKKAYPSPLYSFLRIDSLVCLPKKKIISIILERQLHKSEYMTDEEKIRFKTELVRLI